jgi:hypothetical protein
LLMYWIRSIGPLVAATDERYAKRPRSNSDNLFHSMSREPHIPLSQHPCVLHRTATYGDMISKLPSPPESTRIRPVIERIAAQR